MKSGPRESENQTTRMELKYCEHCGGLWVRECGAGAVYCENCQRKVADLPVPKKKPQRVKLPVRSHAAVEDYKLDIDDGSDSDLQAAGGAA